MAIDVVGSKEKANTGYGNASYLGPASDLPGENTTADFEACKPGPVLDTIKARGTTLDETVTGQLRSIADKNVPDHPHMTGPTSAPKVPGTLIDNEAPLPTQPGA